jgi:RNA polymerase sigma-70 factor (ECF subfamily)
MTRADRLEAVMHEVVEPVRRYLARRTDPSTADDVLSETLVVLWRRIEEIPDDAIAWSIGVARLQLANAERSARRQQRVFARLVALDPPRSIDDHAGDDVTYIRDAIANLRPLDAEVIRLTAWDELSLEQVAGVLGISVNAATIRLHRARKRLKEEIGKTENGGGHNGVKEGEK